MLEVVRPLPAPQPLVKPSSKAFSHEGTLPYTVDSEASLPCVLVAWSLSFTTLPPLILQRQQVCALCTSAVSDRVMAEAVLGPK